MSPLFQTFKSSSELVHVPKPREGSLGQGWTEYSGQPEQREKAALIPSSPLKKWHTKRPHIVTGRNLHLIIAFHLLRPKTKKQYSRDMFVFLSALLVIVAVVYTVRKTPEKLINRDQTEEWKGWMQVSVIMSLRIICSKTRERLHD